MESKGFLSKFFELASGNDALVKAAVDSIRNCLLEGKGEVETVVGKLTPDTKYTLDRLMKGLTGGKLAKVGFSVALTMVFREFKLDMNRILEYFLQLDHSGIGSFQIMIAQVLVYVCVLRAGKVPPRALTEKALEVYKGKSSLRELASVALSNDPSRKQLLREIPTGSDINAFLLSYSGMSPESIVNQCSRHKENLLKGSYKVLPRLHQIWKIVVLSSKTVGKEAEIWDLFVEKPLGIDDKKRNKRVGFSFVAFREFFKQGCRLAGLLTTEFWNVWQDNLFNKKMRDHLIAVELKDKFLAELVQERSRESVLIKLFELLSSVKTLDFIKTCVETILNASDKGTKKWIVGELVKFDSGKRANFSINLLHFIAKTTPELQKLCVKKLLRYGLTEDTTSEIARIKVLNLASDLKIHDAILGFFRKDSDSAKHILNKLLETQNWVLASSEDKQGKRQPGELSLMTTTQLESLKQVVKMLALEGILYQNPGDFEGFMKIVKRLVSNKAKNFDELCFFLLSALTKPVGYMRNCVGKVFKGFVNEVSEEFLGQICRIVETGDFSIETGEESKDETQDGEILNEETGLKRQEKNLKDSFLARATEFLEIVVKKSENIKDKLKVYLTLVTALRAASRNSEKQHLVYKFGAILGKIHKKNLKVSLDDLESLKTILFTCLKSISSIKHVGKILSKNASCLLSLIQSISPDTYDQIITEFITKYFEKHSSQLKLDNFLQIINNNTEDPEILKRIWVYIEKGRNPMIQVQASETVKFLCKVWKLGNSDYLRKLIKLTKKVQKQEIKLKLKNSIQKNLLCSILAVKKHCKDLAGLNEELEELQNCLLNRANFHGLFKQIKTDSS